MTSSHQTLAAALATVVMSSFDSPGQYGARRRRASMIFLASVQESLSVISLIPMSEGLSLMTASAGGVVGGWTAWERRELEELDDEGATEEPVQVESIYEGSRVEDEGECWVGM